MVWVAIVTPELYLSAPETFCALFQLLDILSVREGIYILAVVTWKKSDSEKGIPSTPAYVILCSRSHGKGSQICLFKKKKELPVRAVRDRPDTSFPRLSNITAQSEMLRDTNAKVEHEISHVTVASSYVVNPPPSHPRVCFHITTKVGRTGQAKA